MKHIYRVLAAFCCGGLAQADESTITLLPSRLELPRQIGPLTLEGEPHQYDRPELGVSWQYSGNGVSLTVYVYDGGLADLADGPDTIPVCREFEIAKEAAQQAYQNFQLKGERLVTLAAQDGAPLVREAQLEYERSGKASISYVWLTAVDGRFLKLRFSADPKLRDELPDARRALLTAMGDAVRPRLKPAAKSEQEHERTSIALNLFDGSDDDMATGMMYLAILSATVDQAPEAAPVCGGEFVPAFVTELDAWNAVLEMEKTAQSKVAKTVASARQAGFLEEFVWVDLHRQDWGMQTPAELTIPEYEAWRAKHLKRFKRPNYGSVVFNRPRPLPIEPL